MILNLKYIRDEMLLSLLRDWYYLLFLYGLDLDKLFIFFGYYFFNLENKNIEKVCLKFFKSYFRIKSLWFYIYVIDII